MARTNFGAHPVGDQLGPARRAVAAKEPLEMRAHRAIRNAEDRGDFLVRVTGGDQLNDLPFALRQIHRPPPRLDLHRRTLGGTGCLPHARTARTRQENDDRPLRGSSCAGGAYECDIYRVK